jgi:hypothetical protein
LLSGADQNKEPLQKIDSKKLSRHEIPVLEKDKGSFLNRGGNPELQ